MTDTTSAGPTDAELDALWGENDLGPEAEVHRRFARAVLAKWGTPPAVAGKPVAPDFYTACALYEEGGEAGWIPLPGYSNETERGVKHLVLEAARKEGYKGTATGRLMELGWEIRPVYLTQQPTQARAGAVPLTFIRAQRERLYYNRPENVGKGLSMADWHRVVEYIEAAHGIKGG